MFTTLGVCHRNRSDSPSSFPSLLTGAATSSLHQRSNAACLEILSVVMLTDLSANFFPEKGEFYLTINVTI